MAKLTNEELYEALLFEMTNHSDRTVEQWHRYRYLQDKADGRDPDSVVEQHRAYAS